MENEGCLRNQVGQPFLLTNISFSKSYLKGAPPGVAPSVSSCLTPGHLPWPQSPSWSTKLASLKAVLKPLSGFLWPWVHGAGQGETPGLNVGRPSISSQPSRAGCSVGPASPSRPSSSVPDLCPKLLHTLCLQPETTLLLSRLVSVALWEKLRLDHLVFFFFSGHHHQFTPTLCLAFQAHTIQRQPTFPTSSPCPPALTSPLPRCPPHVHPDPVLCIV